MRLKINQPTSFKHRGYFTTSGPLASVAYRDMKRFRALILLNRELAQVRKNQATRDGHERI